MIFERFFHERSPETAYKVVRKLLKLEMIRYISGSYGDQFAITLTEEGFEFILPRLPKLKENGFKTEAPSHDLLCTAALLGDWVDESPIALQIFSEQLMRRVNKKNFPSWVPNCSEHRSDGIWNFKNGDSNTTLALEVELSTKTNAEYKSIGVYYDNQTNIEKVIWIVPSRSIGRRLNTHFTPSSSATSKHNFISTQDFIQNEWSSVIFLGSDKHRTLADVLNTCLPHAYPKGGHKKTLDMSKKPFISAQSKPFDYVAFCR